MAEIDILLASYNGEKYIAEQIDSILGQTFQDFRLLIRDDGSTDGTPAIIEDYARRYPGKIEIVHDDKGGGNFCRNFFELLGHAQADYVMFCDQDDYWLPFKLQIMHASMKETEQENPGKAVMVFSGLEITDEKLNSLDNFRNLDIRRKRYSIKYLLINNCANGCVQMLNRELYTRLGTYSETINFHDWWTSLCAAAVGVIRYVPMALIKYRQHGSNVAGADIRFRRIKIIWSIVRNPFRKWQYSSRKFRLEGEKYKLLRSSLLEDIPPERLKHIDSWLNVYGNSRLARLKAFAKSGSFMVCGIFESVMLLLKILLF